jgi:phosphoglycolate phosphatase-like HAD superfamily hydrolase
MKPAILFDIDGTLLYAKGLGRPAFQEAFQAAYGVTADFSDISFIGATDTRIIRDLATQFGVISTPAKEEHFFIELTQRLDARLRTPNAILIYPGVQTFLQALTDSGKVLGVVTGNIRTTAWSKLIHAGLASWFSFGAYASDHPDRDELARIACTRAQARDAQARLLIGDTPKDIQAAHAAGLPCLAVATGWISAAELRDAGADAVVNDFTDLTTLLPLIEAYCHD